MTIQEPASWLVSTFSGKHDLDNIILNNLKEEVLSSVFQLDHILIEGTRAFRVPTC